jgi:glycosyltransferase involved in cell wall biosynthesis
VTDAGDSALIVGDTGSVVRPKNPDALANAWRELIEIGPDGRGLLGAAARRRIDQCFSLRAIAARYEDLYAQIAAHGRNRYYRQPVNEQTRAEHVRR